MQVGNVYIDVKVVGSNIENIVDYYNVRILQIVETAGTSLPYVCGSLITTDESIGEYFQGNNLIEIIIGESPEISNTFTVELIDPKPPQKNAANTGFSINFGGFIGPASYMVDKKSVAYAGNSLLVAKRLFKETSLKGEVISNIASVNENQVNWRQTQESDCSFLINTLLHMDIRPSFPLFSFDKFQNLHLNSFDEVKKGLPKHVFVPYTPVEKEEIQYLRNFNVDSFKTSYNLYSGYNKITEVYSSVSGIPQYVIDANNPLLASTMISETRDAGSRVVLNRINSPNVHKTYNEAFVSNTNKLLSLSSIIGCIKLNGYHPEIAPTDLVEVRVEDETKQNSDSGLYLVDSVVTNISIIEGNITTYVYVTRDNKNNVENYVTVEPAKIKIRHNFLEDLNNAVADLRVAAAVCGSIMDGSYLNRLREYSTSARRNFMRMFSIAGVTIDLNAQKDLLRNFLLVGNSLMNTLLSMIFPIGLYNTFKDFLILKQTSRELVSKAVAENVPPALQDLVQRLIDSISGVHDTLNSIAEDNGVTVKGETQVPTTEPENINDEGDRVTPIIDSFENNTPGLDIPFPLIELTEEQSLMPENDLKNYIANQTILNLADLGYLNGVDADKLKDILLGKSEVDYNLINQINRNAGDTLNYRFWGTYGPTNEALYAWISGENVAYTKTTQIGEYTRFYNDDYSPYMGTAFHIEQNEDQTYSVYYEDVAATRDEQLDVNSNALMQLTSFYINDSFKDRYRTLPCTKLISALRNARIFFACPEKEKDIKFYINSKRVMLDSFPIDLGYTDIYGNKIPYLVYYTTTGYNSNSTLFEVRQG